MPHCPRLNQFVIHGDYINTGNWGGNSVSFLTSKREGDFCLADGGSGSGIDIRGAEFRLYAATKDLSALIILLHPA
jgi:hypothetical protein